MTVKNPKQTRARLLEAAGMLVVEQGAAKLTLESVAQAAGVSKGGLLHHFASKEALITALVEQLLREFEHDIQQAIDPTEPPDAPERWARAYIRASLSPSELQSELGRILPLLSTHLSLIIRQVRASYARLHARAMQDGLDPARALLVCMATDGFYYGELFGYGPSDPTHREQILAELLRLTETG